jgi:hypothetical protein
MVNRVLGKHGAAVVVIVDQDWHVCGWAKLEVVEKKLEPGGLLGSIC